MKKSGPFLTSHMLTFQMTILNIYIYIYVCVYKYIYIYIYTHILFFKPRCEIDVTFRNLNVYVSYFIHYL
jgi:hypothetical protein